MDLSAIGNATNTVNSLSSIILVSPQVDKGILPMPAGGVLAAASKAQSFFFHYNAERTVSLESDITDEFAEDNTALQNQIALKPEMLGHVGYIAELTDFLQPGSAAAIARESVDKLVLLAPFQPQVALAALIAYQTLAQTYATAAAAVGAVGTTLGSFGAAGASSAVGGALSAAGSATGIPSTQNKQQTAYLFFRQAWKSRTLFTVQTPWEVFQNCAIKSFKAAEEEATTGMTNFNVQFKQMTFTSQAAGSIAALNAQGRLSAQAANEVNFGTSPGVPGPSLQSVLG